MLTPQIIVCHCDSKYVGRTSQRLQKRIKQHVPRLIRNHDVSQNCSNLSHACKKNTSQIIANDSAIGHHLLENPPCASQYIDTNYPCPKNVLLFTTLLLKLRLSNLFNPIFVDTRNFFTV